MAVPVDIPSRRVDAGRLTQTAQRADGAPVEQHNSIARRLLDARWILAVAAGAVALTWAYGGASGWSVIGAWLAIAAAASLLAAPGRRGEDAQGASAGEPNGLTVEGFLSAVANPMVVLDGALSVRLFNQPALDLLPNLRTAEPIAFALRVPDVIDALRSVVEKGGTRRVDYSERVPVDRIVEAQISAVPGAGGRTAYALVVFRDMTQQHRIEQMRADFVANASHELRTPLASLLGFVETLQGPARNDAVARDRFLHIMRSQATRMSRLIDDLLSLSRIELNAHVRPNQPVDLAMVVGHVADTLAPLAEERGVELTIDRKSPTLEVLGERDELIRVFENLVENAIKYGASGGRVEVSLQAVPRGGTRPAEAVVAVRDFGPGIAAEHLPRLTERFYRADVSQSREKGGTGLGLAIVKHIVVRHRGRLMIESQPGQGATFTVRIDTSGPVAS
jgi:two-component system phosphate regulon sensor histidine kinase PhoR